AAEEQSAKTTGQQAPTPEAASAPPGTSPAPAPSATVPPPAAPGAQSIVPAPPGPPAAVSPLEEKLRELKKLRDEGLITDADYEAKKQELLKNF
ncbi:MAG TPA: SHOCT domain-containing protein, partial [Nitrospiria bacterium]|nr:SHOCT domain-containing protein [Nitrospiria bacterium]